MNAQPKDRNTIAKSKRIATNTLVLFVRMMAIMVINLYAVRVVLNALGTTDYGIFNAIAGVILTSTFLNTTLAISIQRFFSYSIGRNEKQKLREIFSSSLSIVVVLSIVILIAFETVGLWFVETQMIEPTGKIPIERIQATLWIFQLALFSFLFTLLQLPYTAAIFAHEDMGIYAVISFLECVARLGVAFLISHTFIDRLVFYGGGLLAVACLVFLAYFFICRHNYAECHYQRVSDKTLYGELLSFSGWAMYGAMAGVGIVQGTNILLTIFFGPVTVACYAIANQIYNAATSLCNSIVLAFRPAMVKSYAEGDSNYLIQLFNVSNKFILYMLGGVALPLMAEMRTILTWWLGNADEDTVLFSRLILVMLVILALHNPITTIIQSTGHVRNYYLTVDTITLGTIPATWLFFRLGMPASYAFISMIVVCAAAHVIRLFCLHHSFPQFSYSAYCRSLIIPGLFVILPSATFTVFVHTVISAPVYRFLAVFISSQAITSLLVYLLGINATERQMLRNYIIHYIKH